MPESLAARLNEAIARLKDSSDTGKARGQLARLREDLVSAPAKDAARAIRRILDSNADVATGVGFKVGARGFLTQAPTLRTFLLDCLGQIDSVAGAEYARAILSRPDSPDEWALALRNLALGDDSPAGRELLEEKTAELIRNQTWQHHPSPGYLEAFDAAVFLGGTNLVPTLGELVRNQDNPAVAHAAYLALDRLVAHNPVPVLDALESDPGLMLGREATRADYFARADVRDAQQRQLLERYLLDPQRSAAEWQQFAGVYPNANCMISQNLLTPCLTPDRTILASQDAASLAAVEDWLADARFANRRPQLLEIEKRLAEFVRQAGRK
jgi:hypothetical protein